jgi:hypothetical protein
MVSAGLSRNTEASWDQENIGSGEAEKGEQCHANRYISTTSRFSNCGNIDFYFSETIKLYRCNLSHCHWHSRIDPMIGLRILYCETPISITQCREIGKLNNPAQRKV